jgi:osmotically-inducible protein OsmY
MSRKHRDLAALTLLGLLLGLGGWSLGAAQDEPKKATGQSVGEKVDSVVQSIKKGARETSESIREQYNRARTAVHNMGVSARVYSRLHWDKALHDAQIDLDVKDDGVATLKGAVADVKAKAKALELAQDTIGVTRVVDLLTVHPLTDVDRSTTAPVAPKP